MATTPIATPNFMLHNLSKIDLTHVNTLLGNELEKLQKGCRVKRNCTTCENVKLCDWLHLAQLQVLNRLNGSYGVELN